MFVRHEHNDPAVQYPIWFALDATFKPLFVFPGLPRIALTWDTPEAIPSRRFAAPPAAGGQNRSECDVRS
jgi:hypothetical protein